MATIRDVAKRAGVSVATVSHVLNGTRPVLPDTRSAVLTAVEDLSYRPSAVARGLTTNTTRTIGVVIADVTSPFFAFLLRHIEDSLGVAGYNLLVCNTFEQPEREAQILELLLDKRVDGVLLAPTGLPQTVYNEFNERQIPLVFVDRRPPGVSGSFVGTDNRQAAYDVTRYLINLGHCRIGLISLSPETSAVTARVAGYRHALEEAGIGLVPERLVAVDYEPETAYQAARQLLSSPEYPTALIAGSHTATLGTLRALRDLKLRYPDDISLVCFDNSRWTDVIQPALTVVTKPIEALATSAVQILLGNLAEVEKARKRYQQPNTLPTTELFLDSQLVVRESCRPILAHPDSVDGVGEEGGR